MFSLSVGCEILEKVKSLNIFVYLSPVTLTSKKYRPITLVEHMTAQISITELLTDFSKWKCVNNILFNFKHFNSCHLIVLNFKTRFDGDFWTPAYDESQLQ